MWRKWLKFLFNKRGGGGTKIEQPSPPPQPSTADAIQAWANAMPQIYETQLQYAPLEAAQQVQLAQQFAGPLGQAYQQAQAAMYPETAAIQEEFASKALTGAEQGLTPEEEAYYRDIYASQLGTNAGSPIGAGYMGNAMLAQDIAQKQYYQNLGLSLAGRQPLAQPQAPGYSNYMQGFTPGQNMGFMADTYGTYGNAYANMYGANAQLAAAQQQAQAQMIGGALGGFGSALGKAGSFGTLFFSSKRLKHNIQLWVKH